MTNFKKNWRRQRARLNSKVVVPLPVEMTFPTRGLSNNSLSNNSLSNNSKLQISLLAINSLNSPTTRANSSISNSIRPSCNRCNN